MFQENVEISNKRKPKLAFVGCGDDIVKQIRGVTAVTVLVQQFSKKKKKKEAKKALFEEKKRALFEEKKALFVRLSIIYSGLKSSLVLVTIL